MAKSDFFNLRYSVTADELEQLKRIQTHYQDKLRIPVSQIDTLRYMMQDVERLINTGKTLKFIAS